MLKKLENHIFSNFSNLIYHYLLTLYLFDSIILQSLNLNVNYQMQADDYVTFLYAKDITIKLRQ